MNIFEGSLLVPTVINGQSYMVPLMQMDLKEIRSNGFIIQCIAHMSNKYVLTKNSRLINIKRFYIRFVYPEKLNNIFIIYLFLLF